MRERTSASGHRNSEEDTEGEGLRAALELGSRRVRSSCPQQVIHETDEDINPREKQKAGELGQSRKKPLQGEM